MDIKGSASIDSKNRIVSRWFRNEFDAANADAISSIPDLFDAWLNSANLDSADENTTTADGLNVNSNATSTNWTTGDQSSPVLYRTVGHNGRSAHSIAAFVKSNADANNEYAGVIVIQDNDNTKFGRIQVGYNTSAHNETITGLVAGQSNVHVAATAGNISSGMWVRATRCGAAGTDVLLEYNTSADPDEYPSEWVVSDYIEGVFAEGSSVKLGLIVKTGNTSNNFDADFMHVIIEE